jgi:ferric-dicitrate binding protein FerR (iron transport regulator)
MSNVKMGYSDKENSMPPQIRELFGEASSTERGEMDSVWAIFQDEGEARAQAFDADQTWAKIEREVNLKGTSGDEEPASGREKTKTKKNRPARRTEDTAGWEWGAFRLAGMRTVALTVGLVVVALGAWLWTRPVTVTTAKGTQVTTSLPDGSTVELNGGSTLSYRRGYDNVPFMSVGTRRVRLEGEAFFSVQPGDRPFVVSTPNAQVTVLGTKFTVETFSDAGPVTTQVTLRSGRLQFAAKSQPAQTVTLDERGRRSQVAGTSGRPAAPEQTDLMYAEAWRQGGFAVREMPLSVTLLKLERQFGTSIRLEAEMAETRPMTLLYGQDADLKEILNDICLVQNLSYRATSQGYVLTGPKE